MEGRLETVQAEITTLVTGQNEILGRAQIREQELKLKTAVDSYERYIQVRIVP
jgi:hypothetical protein